MVFVTWMVMLMIRSPGGALGLAEGSRGVSDCATSMPWMT
jgi:hypothetical protein